MRTQRLFAYAFAVCCVSLLAGPAMADVGSGNFNAFLQGQYQVSGTVTCSTGPEVESIGSEPTLFDTFTGVITYDGHGHATLKDEGVDIIGTDSPFTWGDETCKYSYEVARDGSFTQTSSCTDSGKSYLLSGIKERGQIGVGGEVLITHQIGRDVETLELPPGTIIQYRICGGVATAVRIHPH
jgi:hypothetical protein